MLLFLRALQRRQDDICRHRSADRKFIVLIWLRVSCALKLKAGKAESVAHFFKFFLKCRLVISLLDLLTNLSVF